MTPRPDIRDDWYRAVVKSGMSNATKLLMVVLADEMKFYGEVSVPRSQLAAKLGVQPRRITERIQEAHDAGWLATVVIGRPGMTAVYQAAFAAGADVSTKKRRGRRRSAEFAGADVSTKTEMRTGAPTTSVDLVPKTDPSDGADVRPNAERGHGAPVQPPSTTHPPFVSAPSVAREEQERHDEKGNGCTDGAGTYVRGNCALCRGSRRLGPDRLCSECTVASTVKARSA